jgi:hypothetical protein
MLHTIVVFAGLMAGCRATLARSLRLPIVIRILIESLQSNCFCGPFHANGRLEVLKALRRELGALTGDRCNCFSKQMSVLS